MTVDNPRARKPATIYDVASVAGVSHQTVSRFLQGYAGIRPQTRDKVIAAISQLDYRTNVMARNLRNGRTGMISLAIPSLNQPYFAELAQHVIHAARRRGLEVFVETTEGNRDLELAIVSGSRASLVDGIIYAPLALGSADLAAVDPSTPLVLLGDRILRSSLDHVTLPNAAGARAAVEHLIAQGRRRIAVIGAEQGTDYGAAPERLAGYQDALASADIAFDEALVVTVAEWVRSAGAAAIDELITSGVDFDAVFCFNDALALGVLRGLQLAGIRVPDDVHLVGFDDTEDSRYSMPALTSISPGVEEVARIAVDLLDAKLKSLPGSDVAQDLVSSFQLMVRESSPRA